MPAPTRTGWAAPRGRFPHPTAPPRPDGLAAVYALQDISPISDPARASSGYISSCLDSASRARFWWLSDPLWSREGNERQAEHHARHAMWFINRGITSHQRTGIEGVDYSYVPRNEGLRTYYWPLDTAIAFGFPNSRRVAPRSYWINDTTFYTWQAAPEFYQYGGYSFVPDHDRFAAPLQSTPADCAVEWDRGAERMITREKWHNLEPLGAVFRRGAQMLVVAAAVLPKPLASASANLNVHLALGRIDDMTVRLHDARIDADHNVRVAARVNTTAYLASLEVVGKKDVGRARYGAPVPPLVNGFGISVFVLVGERFERGGMPLEAALLPSTNLRSIRGLGRRARGSPSTWSAPPPGAHLLPDGPGGARISIRWAASRSPNRKADCLARPTGHA